jgi:hypothetical protein
MKNETKILAGMIEADLTRIEKKIRRLKRTIYPTPGAELARSRRSLALLDYVRG